MGAKKSNYCDPTNGVLCNDIIELGVIVKHIGESVIDMQHMILGNGKDGMKVEQSKQSEAIKQMDKKLDVILAEQKISSDERIIRIEQEKQQRTEKEKEEKMLATAAANRQWTWRWVMSLVFEKFSVPIVVAIVMAALLGGK